MLKTKPFYLSSILILILLTSSCSSAVSILNDYTLRFIFTENEQETLIPDYADVYLLGDWNNWNTFLKLEENSGGYEYTFSAINVASFEYKLYMSYADVEPSKDDSLEIILYNNTFVVGADDGDNYINQINVPLTSVLDRPLRDEEIVLSILETVNDLTIDWSYYHIETEGVDNVSIYMGKDDSEYGSFISYKEESTTYKYYSEGNEYIYIDDGSLTNSNYTQNNWDGFHMDYLDKYTKTIDFILEIDSNIEWELTKNYEYSTYILVLTNESTSCTYTTDFDYNLLRLSYVDSEQSCLIEKSNDLDVKKSMSYFNPKGWESVSNLEELLSRVMAGYNYTLDIDYTDFFTPTYDSEEEIDSSYLAYSTEYRVKLYYTKDALLVEYFVPELFMELVPIGTKLDDIELYVNDYENNETLFYKVVEPSNRYASKDLTNLYLVDTYQGQYQDMIYSITSLYPYLSLIQGEDGEDNIEYTFDFSNSSLFYAVLNSVFYANNYYIDDGTLFDYEAAIYRYDNNLSYDFSSSFDKTCSKWDINYDTGANIIWSNEEETEFWRGRYEIYTSIYNIDRTYIDNSYSEYLL